MNIRDELLRAHSKAQAEKIYNWVGADATRFAELMKFMLGPNNRLSQRAAWPVSYCIQRHPDLAKPYFKDFVAVLEDSDSHVAVRRNVARLLQFVKIPKRHQGRIFDACYKLIVNPAETVAVRCFSMTVAAKIAKDELALMEELRLAVTAYPQASTAGIRARTRSLFGS